MAEAATSTSSWLQRYSLVVHCEFCCHQDQSLSMHGNRFFCRILALEMNTGNLALLLHWDIHPADCESTWLHFCNWKIQYIYVCLVGLFFLVCFFLVFCLFIPVHFLVLLSLILAIPCRRPVACLIWWKTCLLSDLQHSLAVYTKQQHRCAAPLWAYSKSTCLSWNFILFFTKAQSIWLLFSAERRHLKRKKSFKSQNGIENHTVENICRGTIKMQFESMKIFHFNTFKLIFLDHLKLFKL